MRSLNIPEDSTSNRVTEEQKNVTVDAWVYATTEEADNDLHIILGTDPTKSPVHYLTAEVTGLPPSGPFRAPLTQARKEAVGAIGIYVHAGSYKILPQPEHVQVSGSLFYDVDHSPGTVGPSGMRPSTSWEIHPVTQITGL
jgi:hypothetical protein